MEQASMTALVSAFARAYHAQTDRAPIFSDTLARRLIRDEEYAMIAKNMTEGVRFFLPSFEGTPQEALARIVSEQLAPAPLERAAFAESRLHEAVRGGARQYLILGAGYDTFAWRRPEWARDLEIFEIDAAPTSRDKCERLKAAGLEAHAHVHFIEADFTCTDWPRALCAHPAYRPGDVSFCAMLGLTYYLPEKALTDMLDSLKTLCPAGGEAAFDYPDEYSFTPLAGERARKQAMLAAGANERMQRGYSRAQMEALLAAHGMTIGEHLTPDEMTARYFAARNAANPGMPMTAFDNVNVCLARWESAGVPNG